MREHLLMKFGQALLKAIETQEPKELEQVIFSKALLDTMKQLPDVNNHSRYKTFKKTASTSRIVDLPVEGKLGLTALHVVAKYYFLKRNQPGHAKIYNQMASALLAMGADPYKPFGVEVRKKEVCGVVAPWVVNPGRTIAEECGGVLPPSLKAHFQSPGETQGRNISFVVHSIRSKNTIECGCPNADCANFGNIEVSRYRKKGFRPIKHNGTRVQRYQCLTCQSGFNGNKAPRQHRPDVNYRIFKLVVDGLAMDQIATVVSCSPTTVERKIQHLAKTAKDFHLKQNIERVDVDFKQYPSRKNQESKDNLHWIVSYGTLLGMKAPRKTVRGEA